MNTKLEASVAELNLDGTIEQSRRLSALPISPPSPLVLPEILTDILLYCTDSNYADNRSIFYRLIQVNRIFNHAALPFLYSTLDLVILHGAESSQDSTEAQEDRVTRAAQLQRTLSTNPQLSLLVKSIRVSFTRAQPGFEEGEAISVYLRRMTRLEKVWFMATGKGRWLVGLGPRQDWIRKLVFTLAQHQRDSLKTLVAPQLLLSSIEVEELFQNCSRLKIYKGNIDVLRPTSLAHKTPAVQIERWFATNTRSNPALRYLLHPSKDSLRFVMFSLQPGNSPLLLDQFHNLGSLLLNIPTPRPYVQSELGVMAAFFSGDSDGSQDVMDQFTKIVHSVMDLPNLHLLSLFTDVNPYLVSAHLEAQFLCLPPSLVHFCLPPSLVHFCLAPLPYPDLPWAYLINGRGVNLNVNIRKISLVAGFHEEGVPITEEDYFGISVAEIKENFNVEIEWIDHMKLELWIEKQFYPEGTEEEWLGSAKGN